jgi:rare lipoprotein A
MRKLLIGCWVAALVALTAKSEAGPPLSFVKSPQRRQGFRRRVPALTELPIGRLLKGELGMASWYGEESSGVTASGELFDRNRLTAAHRTLPLGSKIEVTNLRNNRSLVLRVNDRGPNVAGRLLDVSRAAAERLGFVGSGRTAVRVKVLGLPKQYLAWLQKAPTPCVAPRR